MRNPAAWEQTLERALAHLKPDAQVLEIGCGTGSSAMRLAPHVARYVGTDDAAEMIRIAGERVDRTPCENLTFQTGRPGDGSLPSGPFDAIVAFNVLHLLPDTTGALSGLHELLKPDGVLITKTPCLGGFYRILWPLVRVLRLFGKAPELNFLSTGQLERMVGQAGFTVVERGDFPRRPPSRFLVAKARQTGQSAAI
jgi:ubiquinone/menaquinone biosynthesis C-methylase UbiE